MSFELQPIKYTDNIKIVVDKFNEMMKSVSDGIATVREEPFVATLGQKAFTLPSAYRVGANLLDVYVGGIRQRLNIDYHETNETTVTFIDGLLDGDAVSFKWFAVNGEVLLGKVEMPDISDMPDRFIPGSKVEGMSELTTALADTASKVGKMTTFSEDYPTMQAAVDATIPGGKLTLAKGLHAFDGLIITKQIDIDLNGSEVTGASLHKNIIEVKGTADAKNFLLTTQLKRRDRKIYLSESPINISPRDYIVITDDSVRFTDKNPDMNLETHQVLGTDPIEKSITLVDFIRIPKAISTVKNVYKINPVKKVKIRNGTLKMKEGSTAGQCISFDMAVSVKVHNIKTERSAGSCVSFRRSHDVEVDGFHLSSPQVTGGGQGYGIQLFAGVNKFVVKNGESHGLRHTFDASCGFDGLVYNVKSYNSVSSQFVASHNGWGSDIHFDQCEVINGLTYAFQVSTQGLAHPYDSVFYGLRITNFKVTTAFNEAVYQHAIYLASPVKESSVSNGILYYGDGSITSGFSDGSGILMTPSENEILFDNISIKGYVKGVDMYNSTARPQSNSKEKTIFRNISIENVVTGFINSYGDNKNISIENISFKGVSSTIFRFAAGKFREINIKNVSVIDSESASLFFTPPPKADNGTIGQVENIKNDTGSGVALPVIEGKILSYSEMFYHSSGDTLPMTSVSDVVLAGYPLKDGIVEGQKLIIVNLGTFKITIPISAKLSSKSGISVVLTPKQSMSLVWIMGSWREV